MASDNDRSGTPADLGALQSLLPDQDECAGTDAPTSASFVPSLDSHDFSSFTNHPQQPFNQNDWAITDAQMGHWSPGLDTLDSQYFATPDAAALAFPLPPPPLTPITGTGPSSLPAGFGAPDINQEWADITTGFSNPHEPVEFTTHGSSESPVDVTEAAGAAADQRPKIPPKIGTRFSKESLRILRNWLSTHSRRPFPTDEERRLLQHQTGLTKTQILNWLANARRRGKVPDYQISSPQVRSNAASPIPIPRAATPAPQATGAAHFDPLQRWVDSPPEHEPATAAAIARAVASSPPTVDGRPRDDSAGESESGSSRYRPSPSSSVGTSQSSGGSAYSFESRDSVGGGYKANRHRSLRRKRRTAGRRRKGEKTPLSAPMGTFQCTFCTETFSTKHTWQRHEKSLHLALERWVCAPDGPRYLSADGISHCVFCGQDDPNDAHIEGHNFTICQRRDLDDRTFHRKDHLGQHLRLVHNATQADLERPLKEWKMEMPTIKSLCGFCGVTMDTWQARTDHLADHFKLGSTMANWQGDWGFEAPILARLESAIAPYMIEAERVSPFPFAASRNPIESPRHAYELLKLELSNYLEQHYDRNGKFPGADDLHLEACCIIFTAEIHGFGDFRAPSPSWLQDLIMSAGDIVERAKLSPLRFNAENRVTPLKIIGKGDLFEHCPFEAQLQQFVAENRVAPISDTDLQQRAAMIIQEAEKGSVVPSEVITTWFMKLVSSSTAWLADFRLRAQIPLATEAIMPDGYEHDAKTSKIDGIIQSYNTLDERLLEYMEMLQVHGIQPDDENLRQKGLSIVAELDNPEWKAIASQNHSWLTRFKRRHLPWSNTYDIPKMGQKSSNSSRRVSRGLPAVTDHSSGEQQQQQQQQSSWLDFAGGSGGGTHTPSSQPPTFSRKEGLIFFNDPNFDRWVGRQLARWVSATTSAHNPNRHIPTDEEIQHQARWIGYEDGDPWNLTPADNAEWLRRFKRDVGLLNDSGPGLFGSHPLDDVRDDFNV